MSIRHRKKIHQTAHYYNELLITVFPQIEASTRIEAVAAPRSSEIEAALE